MKRREFITLVGGALQCGPSRRDAQQPAMPVIGFLNSQSPDTYWDRLRAFHRGLKETDDVESENVTVLYRWAGNQIYRLPELAADLVRGQVAVIAAGNTPSVLAAKAVTTTIPTVFTIGDDPGSSVSSQALPGRAANLTGINFFNAELAAKRLELLRELVPTATRIAALVNPINPSTEATVKNVQWAARARRNGKYDLLWAKHPGCSSGAPAVLSTKFCAGRNPPTFRLSSRPSSIWSST